MCDKCGNPIWLCRNDDSRVRFEVRTYICQADKELAKRRKDREKKKRDLKDGEYEYVSAVPDFGSELPTRDDYYKMLAEKSSV
ncbi:hypothetical protein Pan2_17 [Pseudanabaena phage Pan2]|nr:hypothetical protein Pan2_17 [Pseudanabaena phage Pan2]